MFALRVVIGCAWMHGLTHMEAVMKSQPRYFWFMVFFVIGVTVVGQDDAW